MYLSIESQFCRCSRAIWTASERKANWMHRVSDSLHLFTKKFVAVLLTLTQKCNLSNFKRTKSKTLGTASTGRMTNWTKPPCDPVQIIRTKDWYFFKFDYRKYRTSYFFTNLHVIYFWNGHRKRRASHWHVQLHTRLAERWRCADLHSDAITLSWMHSGLQYI